MKLLTRKEVAKMCGLSPNAVYYHLHKGNLPQPIRIGEKSVRWVEEEIQEWIMSRPRGGSWPESMKNKPGRKPAKPKRRKMRRKKRRKKKVEVQE